MAGIEKMGSGRCGSAYAVRVAWGTLIGGPVARGGSVGWCGGGVCTVLRRTKLGLKLQGGGTPCPGNRCCSVLAADQGVGFGRQGQEKAVVGNWIDDHNWESPRRMMEQDEAVAGG